MTGRAWRDFGSTPIIEVPLTFVSRSAEKPKVIMSASNAEENRRTGEYLSIPVKVRNARSLRQPARLDREGFSLVLQQTHVDDFYDQSVVERNYYPEVIDLLMRETRASEVYLFDHTLRVEDEAKRRRHGTRLPVPYVHNDYTERSAPQRVRDVLGSEAAERVLAKRWAMINVWRSFGASAERYPLAIADGRSVRPHDYVPVELVYPDRVGEIYHIAYSENQHWFYFPDLQPNEVILLKCFDSTRDERTRYTAHSGFPNPHAAETTAPRESIELRAVVSFA